MEVSLYESDFYAWTGDQAARLRRLAAERANIDLDWDNLAEEIECMGGSERGEIENRLIILLIHLAKLAWSPDAAPRRMWRVTVAEQRRRLVLRTRKSPSLTRYPVEVLDECWQIARPKAEAELNIPEGQLPAVCPWTLDEHLMNQDWLPPEPTEQA